MISELSNDPNLSSEAAPEPYCKVSMGGLTVPATQGFPQKQNAFTILMGTKVNKENIS